VAGSILLYEAAAQRRRPESDLREPATGDGPGLVPEALDAADEPRDASGDPDAQPAPVLDAAGSIPRGNRRAMPTALAPEAVPSDGTPPLDADELLPGEPAADLAEPATDLVSEPAGDTPQV
jgi:hypothetical protein